MENQLQLIANICDAVTLTALTIGLVYSVVTRRRREKQPRLEGGFSLLELMVTVGIIAILAMVALPRYRSFTAEARRGEAMTNLKAIHTYQEAYMVANNTYWGKTAGALSSATSGGKYGFDPTSTGTTALTVASDWNCGDPGISTVVVGGKAGKRLGFKFKSDDECQEMRYGYRIVANTGDFVALAHGGHDTRHWLYEQCTGDKTAVNISTSNCAATPGTRGFTSLTMTGIANGDALCIGSEKPIEIIQDLIDNCKE